ncbi:Ankyrin repeats (3 copies) [Roseimaritima multifibrata]|uniref:Ankyrin repeats (3 copies) n=1 Tax=Roseimaritima multifibrata TaxID=1930274 RepID=A0A517MM13_9BACT|nr:hypothetical protein [Roseimaritima multifibrata]QDS95899.1 Ankyrin repeats (3 copies) [Roseimaritima multifibrata]
MMFIRPMTLAALLYLISPAPNANAVPRDPVKSVTILYDLPYGPVYRRGAEQETEIWKTEGWTPETFFEDPDTIALCDTISDGSPEQLKKGIANAKDLNHQGTKNFTLLHWAYLDNNIIAFRLLLEAGASPDIPLTDHIFCKRLRHYLLKGDTILFTSIQDIAWQFTILAAKHTHKPNLRNAKNDTTLLTLTRARIASSVIDSVLQAVLQTGVDINARGEFHSTAAFRAITWNRADICLSLLKAGAAPDLKHPNNLTIKSVLEFEQQHLRKKGISSADKDALEKWLNAHEKTSANPDLTQPTNKGNQGESER